MIHNNMSPAFVYGIRGVTFSSVGLIATCAVVAALYFLSAKIGLNFASLQPNATAVWPPTGLAIAAIMLWGARIAPVIFLGAILANLDTNTDLITSSIIAFGNTAEALIGAFLVSRFGRSQSFLDSRRGLAVFLIGAVCVATTVSATIGVTALTFGGYSTSNIAVTVWLTWWVGDAVGALVVTPIIMAWLVPRDVAPAFPSTRVVEAVVVGGIGLAIAYFVFGGLLVVNTVNAPVAFLTLPALVWIGMRLGRRATTTTTLLVATVAIWGTVRGTGPFSTMPLDLSLIVLQGFVGVAALCALALCVTAYESFISLMALTDAHNQLEEHVAARTRDLQRVSDSLKESEARWRALSVSSPDHLLLIDLDGKILSVNHLPKGLEKSEVVGAVVFSFVSEKYVQSMQDCFDRVIVKRRSDRFEVEFHDDNDVQLFETVVGPVEKDGQIVALTLSARDMTRHRKALLEVKSLNDQINLLLEATSEGIFGIDNELNCTFANRAAASILGYTTNDLVGRDMHALIHYRQADGAVRPRTYSAFFRTIAERKSFVEGEDVFWTRDTNAIPVHFSSNPILENGIVVGAVVSFRDIAEAQAVARKIDFLATHDALTGLVNRREFEARLRSLLELPADEDARHLVCYVDLDQFKIINDTCGHVAGDELLRQLTLILFRTIRPGDTLARLGGDEFGILITHCEYQKGLAVAEQLRQALTEYQFVWNDKKFTVGASIGAAWIESDGGRTGDVLAEAESACYLAKDAGRNRLHIFQVNDVKISLRRGQMRWVSRLQEALRKNEFVLYAQPIVSIVDRERVGVDSIPKRYEFLLRMRDSELGVILPGTFIPAAERYNLMVQIDRWVVRAAVNWLTVNAREIVDVECWTINLSGQSLSDNSFLEFVQNEFVRTGVEHGRICFEITETAAVANLQSALSFMNALKAQGCVFALDDFGSGMSSFTYLKNFPVDYLKIDGNFVRNIVADRVDRAMVEAVERIARIMHIATVGEFVESEEILSVLREIGVDYAQGFALGKPCPLDELLRTRRSLSVESV